MTKRKTPPVVPPNKLPPIEIRITNGDEESLNAIFKALTTPDDGKWRVRAYYNGRLLWDNDGGQQDINLYFNGHSIQRTEDK